MTNKRKVIITEPLPLVDEELSLLRSHADALVCSSPDHDTVKDAARDADVVMVLYAKITSDILESANKLRGIVRYGVGVDNIDIGKATERRVVVANVPSYAIETVADHAIALLLTLSRKIVVADRLMKTRSWSMRSWMAPPSSIRGIDLSGKTLGLIGFGKIGRAVARRAASFGMRVTTYDPFISKETADEMGVETVGFDELLRNSDFVSLHAPLTSETRVIINQDSLSKMKEGVFIVNTSRGPLIDQRALVKALKTGKVAAAGIDVFSQEPPDPDDPLFELENVVLTPHIAWYTTEALRRLEMTAVEHAVNILNGKVPENVVNPEVLLIT